MESERAAYNRCAMFVSDRILELLAERPRLSVAAIRAALPDCKRVAITTALLRLEEKGLIEPVGWRAYRLASGAATARAVAANENAPRRRLRRRLPWRSPQP